MDDRNQVVSHSSEGLGSDASTSSGVVMTACPRPRVVTRGRKRGAAWASALSLALAACDGGAQPPEDSEGVVENVEDEYIDGLVDPAGDPSASGTCATLYEHVMFGGADLGVSSDAYVPWIGDWWNDRVSSVYVTPGCVLYVYEDVDFGGAYTFFLGSVPWIGGWWNDRISSYTCVCP